MNPLDWSSTEFLTFFAIAIAVSFGIAKLAGSWGRSGQDTNPGEPLDVFQVAYLGGGAEHAVAAANATLIHDGTVEFGSEASLQTIRPLEHPVGELTRAVHRNLTPGDSLVAAENKQLHAAKGPLKKLRDGLVQRGLLVSENRRIMVVLLKASAFAAVLWLGAAKIHVGITHSRPILFLAVMIFLAAVAMLGYTLSTDPFRTRAGDGMLAHLRDENAALRHTARTAPMSLTGIEAATAVGTFGPAIFAGTDVGWVYGVSQIVASRSNSSEPGCGGELGKDADGDGGSCGGGDCGGCGGCGD